VGKQDFRYGFANAATTRINKYVPSPAPQQDFNPEQAKESRENLSPQMHRDRNG
jgi:hypothetical protein